MVLQLRQILASLLLKEFVCPVLQLPLSLVEPSYSHCFDSCLEESPSWGLLPEVLFANNLPEGLPLVQHLTPFFQWASPFPKSFEKVRR